MRSPSRRQSGLAAVEFALILPVMLLILFGIVEFGWLFFQQFGLAQSVRQGVRVGVTINPGAANPNDPQTVAQTATNNELDRNGIDHNKVNVTAVYVNQKPTLLTVSASMPYVTLLGLRPLLALPTPKTLRYSMTMMMENQTKPVGP